MKKLLGLLLLGCIYMYTTAYISSAMTQIYVSTGETLGGGSSPSGPSDTNMQLTDLLDDDWRSGFNFFVNENNFLYQTFLFTNTGQGVANPYSYNIPACESGLYKFSLRNRDGSGTGGLGSIISSTSTKPEILSDLGMQQNSPKPYSLSGAYLRNETTIGSSSSKNALIFEFSSGSYGFGAWFGDVETRTDGSGTAAEIYLYDSGYNLISSGVINPTKPISEQTECGYTGTSVGPLMCGNGTTRFIGFVSTTKQVYYMAVVVGDDDGKEDVSDDSRNGNTEHLSFVGPTVICGRPDLLVTQDISSGAYMSGQLMTIIVNTKNIGNAIASGARLTMSYPSGFVYLTSSIAPSISNTGFDFTLSALQSHTIVITGYIYGNSGDIFVFTGIIKHRDDSGLSNDISIETGYIYAIYADPVVTTGDMGLTISVDSGSVMSGYASGYVDLVLSVYSGSFSGISISISNPSGWMYSGHTASTGIYDTGTNIWSLSGVYMSGDSASIRIYGIYPSSGTYIWTGYISSYTGSYDNATHPNTGSTSVVAVVPVVVPVVTGLDIGLSMSIDSGSIYMGYTGSYIDVSITSYSGVVNHPYINIMFPNVRVYSGHTTTSGIYDTGTNIWSLSGVNISSGSSASIRIYGIFTNTGNYSVTGYISSYSGGLDDAVHSNTGSVVVTVLTPLVVPVVATGFDLGLIKTVNTGNTSLGSTGVYTLMVTNYGPATGYNISVVDNLPSGFIMSNWSATTGVYMSGVWSGFDLGSGQSANLYISGNFVSTGTITNTAYIYSYSGVQSGSVADTGVVSTVVITISSGGGASTGATTGTILTGSTGSHIVSYTPQGGTYYPALSPLEVYLKYTNQYQSGTTANNTGNNISISTNTSNIGAIIISTGLVNPNMVSYTSLAIDDEFYIKNHIASPQDELYILQYFNTKKVAMPKSGASDIWSEIYYIVYPYLYLY